MSNSQYQTQAKKESRNMLCKDFSNYFKFEERRKGSKRTLNSILR